MLYQFNVISSLPSATDVGYFESIRANALEALQNDNLSVSDAWALCEYLDAVDGGDIPLTRLEYRQVTGALQGYLLNNQWSEEALELTKKSWAASTLMGLIPPVRTAEVIQLFAA